MHPLDHSIRDQIHEEEDALNVWMYDAVENNGKYTRWEALAQLTTMFALLGGLFYLSVLYDAPSRNPAVSKCDVCFISSWLFTSILCPPGSSSVSLQ